jgi:putative hydrolase
LSDGDLSPIELIRRAAVNGCKCIGITDHIALSTMERVLKEITEDAKLAEEYWGIHAVVGVELTHVPAKAIASCAKRARELGAELIVVHGETVVEPVEKGTNLAAVNCNEVDVLAHPGFLTKEEAKLAKENGVFIEITARAGHSLTNGHVVRVGEAMDVDFIVNSDGHTPDDLLTKEKAEIVARGAGLIETGRVLKTNPTKLWKRIEEKRLSKQ